MRQFTTSEQTAKLIELGVGFRPALIWKEPFEGRDKTIYNRFSIGELIEFLPPRLNDEDLEIHRDWSFDRWIVFYRGDDAEVATELLDALYNMIVRLKAEGVI